MDGVLEDVRVLDLSRHISGPYCSSLLADMGAEVIRIELPGGDPDRRFGYRGKSGDSYAFANRMRNKKAITLNLKKPKGKKLFECLLSKSDVVLENFAMRDREKLGMGFSALTKINPSTILASISAFGLDGPNKNRIGFDPIAQAISGFMAFNGFPGSPPLRTASAWVDYATACHAAFGIILALRHRDKTGIGQVVDVSLADVAAGLVALHGIYSEYEALGVERRQTGNMSPYAFADAFQCTDGCVFISLTRNGVWKRFLRSAAMEGIGEDPRFASDWKRSENSVELRNIISPWVAERSVEEVVNLLEKAGVPCAPINTIAQAVSEPQYREREILVDLQHSGLGKVSTLGVLTKLSETPGKIRRGAPIVGENNKEVYEDLLGYSEEELSDLKQDGVI